MEENRYTNIIEGLRDIHDRLSSIGDDILSLNDLTTDTEMKALITDLSNNAYVMAEDTEDLAETYREITSEPDEEE